MTAFPPGSTEAALRDAQRAKRLIALSRLALWWEKAWTASWRGLAVVGGILILSLFEIWLELPPGPRIVALSAAMVAAAAFFWHDWQFVFWPSREAGIRRLEDENGLPHRPVSAAEDRLAFGLDDPVTEALWRRHIQRQLAYYGGLEATWPRPDVSIKDPYAIRAVIVLGLVAGVFVAGADAPRRIIGTFAVESERSAVLAGIALDAWITPPAYTALAPVILAQANGSIPLDPNRAIGVPAGSKLTLRLGGTTAPVIERIPLDTVDARMVQAPTPSGEAFTTEFELTRSERIRVIVGGREVGDWEVTVLPDMAPSISFDGDIQVTPRLAVKIQYKAGDDHGVQKAEAHIRLAPEAKDGVDKTMTEGGDELIVKLPANGKDPKSLQGSGFEDLTAHPWAGLPVTVQLVATDALGQTASSEARPFTLPERPFYNPLAKAIVEQRKELSRGPGAIPRVLTALDALAIKPEYFLMSSATYLGIRAAYFRLMQATHHADIVDVQDLMWELALSIEDGGVTLAADKVRQLQKELQAALDRNAPDEEIQKLMDELRQAMREYMQALAENAPNMQVPSDMPTMSQDDLEKMLDQIEQMSKLGNREAAQELLSQLQDMMEGMTGPMAQPSEREQQLAKTLQELNEIVREQEKLRDETFREEQQGRDAGEEAHQQKSEELAKKQAELEAKLKKLEEGMGEKGGKPPGEIGEAGKAMGEAEGQLQQGDTGSAVPSQDEALEKLKSARDAARQALAEEQKKNGGMRVGRGMGRRQPGTDPAGRPEADGPIDNGSVKVPTERETQRARDILNELRKRSGETERPEEELNYLERLLRRF